MAAKEPFVSALYDPDQDHSRKTVRNFAEHVNATVEAAKANRRKKDVRNRYGNYSSKGAQASPESVRLTRRITGEKDD